MMKLHELFLTEDEHTIEGDVSYLDKLKDANGKYLTGTVNVTGLVVLGDKRLGELKQLPVKFGTVNRSFDCSYNQLTSLEGAPNTIGGYFFCGGNQELTSLQGVYKIIKKINGRLYITDTPIKSGGIGLILIEGLTKIYSNLPAFKIINRYLGQGKKGLLRCQEELVDAGYEEYAKL